MSRKKKTLVPMKVNFNLAENKVLKYNIFVPKPADKETSSFLLLLTGKSTELKAKG